MPAEMGEGTVDDLYRARPAPSWMRESVSTGEPSLGFRIALRTGTAAGAVRDSSPWLWPSALRIPKTCQRSQR